MKILAGMTHNITASRVAPTTFAGELNKLVLKAMDTNKKFMAKKFDFSGNKQFRKLRNEPRNTLSMFMQGVGDADSVVQIRAEKDGLHVISWIFDSATGEDYLNKLIGKIVWKGVFYFEHSVKYVLFDSRKWESLLFVGSMVTVFCNEVSEKYLKSNIKSSARKLNAKGDRVWCDISFVTIPSSFRGNENTLLRQKGKTESLKNEKLTPELIANLVGYRDWLMSDEYDNLEELIDDVIKIADGKSKDDEADTFCYVPGTNDSVLIVVSNISPR